MPAIRTLALRLWETAGVDAMVGKESLSLSRRWQTYAFRALYVGGLTAIALAIWLDFAEHSWSYSEYARYGSEMFAAFSGVQGVTVAIYALIAGSDMISREVRSGTLGLLALTPLSPWRIVLGKWKSCLVYQSILLLSGVPVLATALFTGGVPGWQLVAVTALTFSFAMMATAFGILCSTFFRAGHFAMITSIVAMALYLSLPVLVAVLWREDDILDASCWLHPGFSMVVTLVGESLFSGSVLEWSWLTASAATILHAGVLLALAAWRAGRLIETASDGRPAVPKQKTPGGVVQRALSASAIFAERTGVWDFAPCLWREVRAGSSRSFRRFTRISLGGLLLMVAYLVMADGSDPRDIAAAVYGGLVGVIILGAVAAGSAAFTADKEDRKWQVLLTTPATPTQILLAKFLGGWNALGILVATLLVSAVTISLFIYSLHSVPLVVSTLSFVFFTISTGMLFSLWVGTTRKAFSLTLGAILFWLVGFPLLLVLYAELRIASVRTYLVYRDIESVLRATNPFAQIEMSVYGHSLDPDVRWTETVVCCLIYGAMGMGALAVCRSRFNCLAGRSG